MDARSNFKAGIAYNGLRERLALADADPRPSPKKRAAGDMTYSVAVINDASPIIGATNLRPAMHPAQKSTAKPASGSAGSLMAPQRAEMVRAEMVPPCQD
jgi:hypothetical protein